MSFHAATSYDRTQDTAGFVPVRAKRYDLMLWAYLLVPALAICSADWFTKGYARQHMFVFENPSPRPWIVLVGVSVLAAMLTHLTGSKIVAVGCGIALGGMFGNMLELFGYGSVTDWIAMPGGAYANLADFAVCIIPALVLIIFASYHSKHFTRTQLMFCLLLAATMIAIGTLRVTLLVDHAGHPLL